VYSRSGLAPCSPGSEGSEEGEKGRRMTRMCQPQRMSNLEGTRNGYRQACISRIVYFNTALPPWKDRSEHLSRPIHPSLISVSAMLAHLSSNPSTRLETLYWFFLSIPTTLLFPPALSLTGLLIPARALITTSTRGIIRPNIIPKLRIRGGVSRR